MMVCRWCHRGGEKSEGIQPRSNLGAWLHDSCSHVCSSRIGLYAHQQTHRWQAVRRFRQRSPLLHVVYNDYSFSHYYYYRVVQKTAQSLW